jgi:DNA-binding NtrC family response regulator
MSGRSFTSEIKVPFEDVKVLVVDSFKVVCRSLEHAFFENGVIKIDTATDISAALKAIESCQYDIIISGEISFIAKLLNCSRTSKLNVTTDVFLLIPADVLHEIPLVVRSDPYSTIFMTTETRSLMAIVNEIDDKMKGAN